MRSFREKVREIESEPDKWEAVSAHSEKSTRTGGRKHGSSTQTIYKNKDTGETIVRHTVKDDAGHVIDDHFRPDYRPCPGDLDDAE